MKRTLTCALAAIGTLALVAGCTKGGPEPLSMEDSSAVVKAERLMEKGRLEAALSHLEPQLAKTPPHPEVGLLAGMAASKLGRLDEASAWLESVVAQDSSKWPQMTELGFVHENRGDFVRAIEVFEKVVQAAPTKKRAHFGLGRVALAQGDPAGARKHLEVVLRLDPEFVAATYQIARTYADEREWDRALAAADETLASRPSHEQAHYLRATVLARMGRDADADAAMAKREEVYAKKERINGLLEQTLHGRDTAKVHATIGRLYLELGDEAEARKAVTVGLGRFPGDPGLRDLSKQLQ